MCFANIFSPSLASIFIPLTVSFAEQKLLILKRPTYHIFLSWSALLVSFKKSLPNPLSDILLAYLPEILQFCTLYLGYDSFSVNLCKRYRSTSRFFFFQLHMVAQLLQHHMLKRLSFLLWAAICSCVQDQFTVFVWVYFLGCSDQLIQFYILLSIPHSLDYASFILSFDIGSCQSSYFIFLLLHHIGYFRPFYFHITFKIKITYQNFDWDYIK